MPTYITLIRWTDQGIRKVKESPARYDEFKKAVEKSGGKVKGFYLVQGRYDLVTVTEAADDKTSTKLALAVASGGNVRTETMRAFTEEEYRKIIAELP